MVSQKSVMSFFYAHYAKSVIKGFEYDEDIG